MFLLPLGRTPWMAGTVHTATGPDSVQDSVTLNNLVSTNPPTFLFINEKHRVFHAIYAFPPGTSFEWYSPFGNFLCTYFCSLSTVLRGQRASTVVPMPPRGRNTPFTMAHTGSVAFTTSSSTWLTMFSWKIPRLR